MRLGINAVHIVPGGGEHDLVLRQLLKAIPEVADHIEPVLFTDPLNDESFDSHQTVCVAQAGRQINKPAGALRASVESAQVDMLLTFPAPAALRSPVPYVVFFHDVRGVEDAFGGGRWWSSDKLKPLRKFAGRAAGVAAPSDFIRRSLLQWLEIPLDRCTIAPPGVDHLNAAAQSSPADQPYLLCVCQGRSFADLGKLYGAYRRLADQIPHSLVIVAEEGAASEAPADIADRVLRFQRLPAPQLLGLYAECALAVCPDPADPSGLAVLEGMHCGAPVAAAKSGAVPEAARSAPYYCDMRSETAIASAVGHALKESEEPRSHRVRSGKQLASEFTWARTAEKLVRLFERGA
jgi:glycosyltransferase involved in cell wall biosynthesis